MKFVTLPTTAGDVEVNPAQITYLQPSESNTLVYLGTMLYVVVLEPIALVKQRLEGA